MLLLICCKVCRYKRLTELTVENSAVCTLDNIVPGDCIVCFSKNDVYTVMTYNIWVWLGEIYY